MAQLRYPIALASGIARFSFLLDEFMKNLTRLGLDLGTSLDGISYFKGISRHLHDHDFDVHSTFVNFAGPLGQRAADLKNEITNILSRTKSDKVHIIAHSMGGLDARYMIARLDMGDHVASLTTIATPHFGSSFAQWLIDHGDPAIEAISKTALDLKGLKDATPKACAAMNVEFERIEADNAVKYETWSSEEDYEMVFTPLKPAWKIITAAEGPNDGVVSVSSQKWTTELKGSNGNVKPIRSSQFSQFKISADHLNEIGWWDLSELAGALTNPIYAHPGQYEEAIKGIYLQIATAFKANEP
jgi:triacylglycerol lipase